MKPDIDLKNFKNLSSAILWEARPLLHAEPIAIAALFHQAHNLAEAASKAENQENLGTRLQWATAFSMIEQAEREISMRN